VFSARPSFFDYTRMTSTRFRVSRSQPVGGVIEKINPILRGWVKYFAIGHSRRCFSYIRDWVEKKIRVRRAKPAWN